MCFWGLALPRALQLLTSRTCKLATLLPQTRDGNNALAQDAANCLEEQYDCSQGTFFYVAVLAQVRTLGRALVDLKCRLWHVERHLVQRRHPGAGG